MDESQDRFRALAPGDLLPWFRAAALEGSERFAFDTVGGRPILLLFFGSAGRPEAAAALRLVERKHDLFDDVGAAFFGVTVDPSDAEAGRIRKRIPGIRFFLDYDHAVSRAFGAAPESGAATYRPFWLVADSMMRVIGAFPLPEGEAALAALAAARTAPAPDWAPVLMVPNVLPPELCRRLIDLYTEDGGKPSGFMREVDGKTVLVSDPRHKIRRDLLIDDETLRALLCANVMRRLLPMVKRVFQFEATRMERYLIGCYDAGTGGHFRPHRDNTTSGTAHRRFAVTINLNAGEYEGGDLHFPEYGARTYRAPTGGAIVFSCSLLHEATPMTRGTRYAFLPFLYDCAAASLREQNNKFLSQEVGAYRMSPD